MESAKRAAEESAEQSLRSDAKKSRATLLAAARELMAESGPETLTVVAVARRAGLNRSTAYQHFKNREQLLRAVGDTFADEVQRMFSEPRDLGEQVDFFVHYFQKHPNIARVWMFWLLSNDGEPTPEGWDDYVSAIERLARSSRSQDGIDAEMFGVIGMSTALVWSLMVRQRAESEEEARSETLRFARELKRLFLFGALRPESWPEFTAEFENEKPPK
jgi:AcrR family transcriptional regulator